MSKRENMHREYDSYTNKETGSESSVCETYIGVDFEVLSATANLNSI